MFSEKNKDIKNDKNPENHPLGSSEVGKEKGKEGAAGFSDAEKRQKAGQRAGLVGIISNLILCAFKIATGIIAGSVSITADGVNNAGDASSSLMTVIGFKLAGKAADKDHPYGYGRTEYIAGLAVSIMIIAVGFSLFTSSVKVTLNPKPVELSLAGAVVLAASIAAKICQASYFKKTAKKIGSKTLEAAAADSRNDMITTIAVLIAALIGKFTPVKLDGPAGMVVAIFILISGAGLVKETLSPILGKAPDPDLVLNLKNLILSNSIVLGVHDLIIHDYGPGRIFASVHCEIDSTLDVVAVHDSIDNIEAAVYNNLHVLLTIHMDPVDTKDPLTIVAREDLAALQSEFPEMQGFHDVRVVSGPTHINLVFDAVLLPGSKMKPSEFKARLSEKLMQVNPKYRPVITVDSFYE